MRVALTGATGFVGSRAARTLIEKGHQVRAFVRPNREARWLEDIGAEICRGDLTDEATVRSLVAGTDAVIHTAFDPSVFDGDQQIRSFHTNVLGSLTLLELARQADVEQFICTVSTYILRPDVNGPCDVRQDTIDESSRWTSAWDTYVCHNVVLETHCDAYRTQFGMNTTRFRCAWIYGVHPKIEKTVWRSILEDVRAGKTFESTFGGDVVAVQDVAAALVAAVGNPKAYGEVFNLSDMFMYNQEVANLAREVTGSSAKIIEHSLPKPLPIDSQKVKALGVDVRRGLDGVRQYLTELNKLV